MDTWNERLTRAREEKDMSKTALAKAVGVSQPTVTDWESGAMKPKGENLLAICRVLGISPDWLTKGHGSLTLGPTEPGKSGAMNSARLVLLADFDLLLEEDQERIAAEIKKLADVARAYRKRFGGTIADNNKVAQALPPVVQGKTKNKT